MAAPKQMAAAAAAAMLVLALTLLLPLASAQSTTAPAPRPTPTPKAAAPPAAPAAPAAPAKPAPALAPTKAPSVNISAPAAAPSIARKAPGAARPSPAPLPGNASSPALAPGPASSAPATSILSNGTLDPGQISALEALKVPVGSNPCAGSHSTMICDEGTPFRRLIFLQLQYCPADAVLSEDALRNLTGLQALSFFDCPMKPSVSLPPETVNSLTSFSCVASLGKTTGFESMQGLSGVWLSKLHKVQDLTVMDVLVNVSSLSVILANMTDLQELKISNASLKGTLPKTWPANLTTIDLSLNDLQGGLPSFFGELEQLQSLDLTGNNITGHFPDSIGRLRNLQKLSLSSNGISGPLAAAAIANMTSLNYLDLSNNALNGTVPESLSKLSDLRYLDLRNNQLKGILPFNTSFLGMLNSFKASGNPSLCYNSSVTSSKVIVGVPPCDDTGNPISSSAGPALAPGEDLAPTAEPEQGRRKSKHRGPKTIVWAVATALGAIFLFIALVVVFSKWCRWKEA